jgi:hypothetical protein
MRPAKKIGSGINKTLYKNLA